MCRTEPRTALAALNAISGYAQLLEQDSSLQIKPRDQVRVSGAAPNHLSGLIDGILDISKIEAGRLICPVTKSAERIPRSARRHVPACRPPPRGSISSSSGRRCFPVVVYADEKRLRQILINLISNAIKFTQMGSVHFIVHYRSPVAEFESAIPAGHPAQRHRAHLRAVRARRIGISQPQTARASD